MQVLAEVLAFEESRICTSRRKNACCAALPSSHRFMWARVESLSSWAEGCSQEASSWIDSPSKQDDFNAVIMLEHMIACAALTCCQDLEARSTSRKGKAAAQGPGEGQSQVRKWFLDCEPRAITNSARPALQAFGTFARGQSRVCLAPVWWNLSDATLCGSAS